MREIRNLAIMFADISGSTRLYETLGDAKAREVTSRCIALMARVTKEFQGRVIKTIGDEVMCTFPTGDDAAKAAISMQEEVDGSAVTFGVKLSIRVGFHFGEVIEEGGDVFGDAVNLAARMAAQAKADQIITTGETVDEFCGDLREKTRFLISNTVKGKQKPVEIFELTWGEEEDLTIMGGISAKPEVAPTAAAVMKVRYMEKEVEVGENLPTITMGRGQQNHFMILDTMASRMHVKIEYRRGKFVLTDLSTNGTYVMTSQGKKNFIHRDELILEGAGVIGVGKQVTPTMPEAVFYSTAG